MQGFVLGLVVRSIVQALFRRQFDTVNEFDIRALVDFVGLASGAVGNQQAKWTAAGNRQWSAGKPVNKYGALQERRQRNTGVEVIRVGMHGQESRIRPNANQLQKSSEPHGRTVAFGINLVYIQLIFRVETRQVARRDGKRAIQFAF